MDEFHHSDLGTILCMFVDFVFDVDNKITMLKEYIFNYHTNAVGD